MFYLTKINMYQLCIYLLYIAVPHGVEWSHVAFEIALIGKDILNTQVTTNRLRVQVEFIFQI